jgi:hypothetical protein
MTPFQNYVLGWRLEQKQRGWAKVIDLDRTPSPMLQTHRPRFSIPFFDKASTMEVVELLFLSVAAAASTFPDGWGNRETPSARQLQPAR